MIERWINGVGVKHRAIDTGYIHLLAYSRHIYIYIYIWIIEVSNSNKEKRHQTCICWFLRPAKRTNMTTAESHVEYGFICVGMFFDSLGRCTGIYSGYTSYIKQNKWLDNWLILWFHLYMWLISSISRTGPLDWTGFFSAVNKYGDIIVCTGKYIYIYIHMYTCIYVYIHHIL